jgi:hypothetical protein
MRKLFVTAALALLPLAAQAQFNLGLRLGYAPAMGDAEKDLAMSDVIKSQIPIQVDAMYTVAPDVAVGAYLSYGFGQVDFDGMCDLGGVDCSGRSTRVGLQAAYTFSNASPTFLPWVGAGFGYEWGSMTAELGGFKAEQKARGFEFLNLQAGGEVLHRAVPPVQRRAVLELRDEHPDVRRHHGRLPRERGGVRLDRGQGPPPVVRVRLPREVRALGRSLAGRGEAAALRAAVAASAPASAPAGAVPRSPGRKFLARVTRVVEARV